MFLVNDSWFDQHARLWLRISYTLPKAHDMVPDEAFESCGHS